MACPKEAIEKEEEKLVGYRTLKLGTDLCTWKSTKSKRDREKAKKIGELRNTGSEKQEQYTSRAKCLQDFKKEKLHGNFVLNVGDISDTEIQVLKRTGVRIHRAENSGVTNSEETETALMGSLVFQTVCW